MATGSLPRMTWADAARVVSDEYVTEGRPIPGEPGCDELAFWDDVEHKVHAARTMTTLHAVPGFGDGVKAVVAEAKYDPNLHPRNRMGRWIRSLGLPRVYEVGGAVRDELLGKDPSDIDYMAMASPEEIKAAVEAHGGVAMPLTVRDRMVGVRAYMEGVTPPGGVEIAPPRVEVSTGESRKDFLIVPHPEVVEPTGADPAVVMGDDAVRRDFTVNALYRDENDEVIDPTGQGVADLGAGVLRTTHESSFRDDPLRILRGARFASQHGLTPDDATMTQMRDHADAVTALTQGGVSGTVVAEMDKLLMGDNPLKGLRLLRDSGAFGYLFPEAAHIIGYDQQSDWHNLTLDEHTFRVVQQVANQGGSLEARWAALLHDIGKPDVAFVKDGKRRYYASEENGKLSHEEAGVERARTLLNRLGNTMSDERKRRILTIVREHMLREADKPTAVKARRIRARIQDDDTITDILIHRRADMRSKGEDDDPIQTPEIDKLGDLIRQADEEGAPRSLADLAVTGRDIVGLGAKGPQVGEILDDMLREVVNQPSVNRQDWLLTYAAKWLRKPRPTT